ncbi:MAG TPA: Type 1 glutamine amidotransferase-like domain-containing protein [Candidatus Saccharimonadales bacterium]|nr:Type 1 glutamine amidotransferase-like domain-containing protein [Candidatus Saccharimonadales bacterium]
MRSAEPGAGLLALCGGDEFHRGNEPQDAVLAAAACGPAYVVATAAARSHPEMAVRTAQGWFRRFGLDLVELGVYTKAQAHDPLLAEAAGRSGFCYLTGGDPGLVASVLRDSPVGRAIISAWGNGAVLAGSSAGAMALCAATLVRQSFPGHSQRRALPGLDVVPGSAVLPHHDTFGASWYPSARAALPETVLIGIDERTCALWESGAWRCLGAGGVTVYVPGTETARTTSGALEGIPQPVADRPDRSS